MGHQLPLEFKYNNEFTFDSFVTGSNAELLQALRALGSSEDNSFIYFWGAPGIGKTHLLQALCQSETFNELPVAMISLDGDSVVDSYSPAMLEGLEKMALVCLDGLHAIAGNTEWEHALFHFYNRARDESTPLVVTANCPPAQLAINLQDLKTRLAWGLVLQIHDLDDTGKLQALQNRAKNRGMELNDDVGDFLLKRYSREITDLMKLLERLDSASLTEQRRLTIPFVRQFLGLN